jgi:cytochrome c peroxidase
VLAALLVVVNDAAASDDVRSVPAGLPERAMRIPADNPPTPAKIALGKQFFWDPRWSVNRTVACVSCHQPDSGWTDARRFSITALGQPTPRRAPPIINRVFGERHLWTGLRASLEDQALNDANHDRRVAEERLGAIPEYQAAFRAVFGTDLTADGVAKAIAAYVRTIVSGNAPYDRFVAGDTRAMSEGAQRGMGLFFGKARCATCHAGFNFTDEAYRNTGVGMDRASPDLGRYLVTQEDPDRGAFKTPTLRDVARRGPYMHDGSLSSLRDVVAFYVRGGGRNPWLSPEIRPVALAEHERDDLVAFLQALTGEIAADVSVPPRLPP